MKPKIKINKLRSSLLLIINTENNKYILTSSIKINHILPKDYIKKFDNDNIIAFDNSLVQGSQYQAAYKPIIKSNTKKGYDINISYCNQSITYFTKCIQDLGKSFIDERKIDLGSRKLGFKHSLTIQVVDDVSFKEKIKSTRSIHLFNKSKPAFLSKRELKEKLIQESIRALTQIVNDLRIIPIDDSDGYQQTLTDMNGLSPFQCNLPLITIQANTNSNNCIKESGNMSNDCCDVDWVTPFKQYDHNPKQQQMMMMSQCNNENNNNLNTLIFQTETEACKSMMSATPKQCDRNKAKGGNVSSFYYESEYAA